MIINPINGTLHSILSNSGRTLLKLYLRNYKNGGSDETKTNYDEILNTAINGNFDKLNEFIKEENSTDLHVLQFYDFVLNHYRYNLGRDPVILRKYIEDKEKLQQMLEKFGADGLNKFIHELPGDNTDKIFGIILMKLMAQIAHLNPK